MPDAAVPADDPVAAYRAARTPTEYYAARIAVLQGALPAEVLDLERRAVTGRRRLPPSEARWLRNLADRVRAVGPPVRLRSSSTAPDVRVLIESHTDGAAGLVMLFTGATGRLNLPLAVALQHLPIAGRELVLLGDPTRRAYLDGVPGVATSLPGLAAWVRDRAAGRPIWTLGTSMGGGPAVITGLLAGAVRAAALGGFDPLSRAGADGAAAEIRRALAAVPGASEPDAPTVLCVHAEGSERDAANAEALRSSVGGGRRVVLAGVARHDVLAEAARAGSLQDLLALVLDPGTPIPPGEGPVVLPRRHPADDGPGPGSARPGVRRDGRPPSRRGRLVGRALRALPLGGGLRRTVVAAAYRRGIVIR